MYNAYLRLFYDRKEGDVNTIDVRCPSPLLLPFIIIKRFLGESSIIHHHWFEFQTPIDLLKNLWKLTFISIYRGTGGLLIWSVHNTEPHSGKYINLNKTLQRILGSLATRIHVHSEYAIQITAQYLAVSAGKFFIVPHPPYPVTPGTRSEGRAFLEKNLGFAMDSTKPLFLMYGSVARYKGILEVVKICSRHNIPLLIAGKPKPGETEYGNQIKDIAKNSPSIMLLTDKWISHEEERVLFAACDYVVFNFTDILTSGSVILARSYKKPVIIPDKGCLQEMSGPEFFHFSSSNELEHHLVSLNKTTLPAV